MYGTLAFVRCNSQRIASAKYYLLAELIRPVGQCGGSLSLSLSVFLALSFDVRVFVENGFARPNHGQVSGCAIHRRPFQQRTP